MKLNSRGGKKLKIPLLRKTFPTALNGKFLNVVCKHLSMSFSVKFCSNAPILTSLLLCIFIVSDPS
jgi:hypothetical protein